MCYQKCVRIEGKAISSRKRHSHRVDEAAQEMMASQEGAAIVVKKPSRLGMKSIKDPTGIPIGSLPLV